MNTNNICIICIACGYFLFLLLPLLINLILKIIYNGGLSWLNILLFMLIYPLLICNCWICWCFIVEYYYSKCFNCNLPLYIEMYMFKCSHCNKKYCERCKLLYQNKIFKNYCNNKKCLKTQYINLIDKFINKNNFILDLDSINIISNYIDLNGSYTHIV